jgi:hypothetical protein
VTRIELAFSAWEADVLPLNYTRGDDRRIAKALIRAGGRATSIDCRERIGRVRIRYLKSMTALPSMISGGPAATPARFSLM